MDSNEEYLRLNKDFLLLTALIKSHKTKTAQQGTARSRLIWKKDVRTRPSRQTSSSQPEPGSSVGQSQKYVKGKSVPPASTIHHGDSQSRRYAVGDRRRTLQSMAKGPAHPGSSSGSQIQPQKHGGSHLPPLRRVHSGSHSADSECGMALQDQANVPSMMSKEGRTRQFLSKDLPSSGNSKTSHVPKTDSAGVNSKRLQKRAKVLHVRPKLALTKDVASRCTSIAASVDARHMAQPRQGKDPVFVSGEIPQRVSANSSHSMKASVVNVPSRDSAQVKVVQSNSKDVMRDGDKYLKPVVAPHDGPIQKPKRDVMVEKPISRKQQSHIVAGPATLVTSKLQIPKQETVITSEGMACSSDVCPGGQKRTVPPPSWEGPNVAETAHAKMPSGAHGAKTSGGGSESASKPSDEDKDCEIARMNALSAYLVKLRDRATSKGNGSIPVASPDENSEKQPGGKCDPPSKARLPRSGEISRVTLRGAPSRPCPTASVTSAPRGGAGVSGGPSTSPDKLLSTQRRIRELTADIKRIEEQLGSRSSADRGMLLGNPTEKGPNPSWTAASPSSSATKGRVHSLLPSSPKSRTAYSWHASGQSGSDHGSSQDGLKVMRVPKVSRRTLPYKLVGTGRVEQQRANLYRKINTDSERAAPVAAGSKSLLKTRSRYKVRRSQGPQRRDHSAQRLGRGARRRVNRGRPVAGHAVSRSFRDAQQQRSTKLIHGANTSPYKMHTKKHGKCYSPYKMRQSTRRTAMWEEYDRRSFVTRRLHHMVTHSPMLFRSNPSIGGHRSLHKLDRIWHSRRSCAKLLRWQVPGSGYSTPHSPHFVPTSHPYLTPRRSQLVLKRHPHHQREKARHSEGKQPTKKVMNVVRIGGVRYARHGKSLRRLPSDDKANQLHPRGRDIAPVTHWKMTNTKIVAKQVLHRSIHFSRMLKSRKSRKQEYCMFFNRFGRCNKGESCPYKHDPEKVAICTRFLRGTCKLTGGTCLYSHEVTRDKMPVCRFFLRGVCTQEDCPYSHVKVNNSASICRDFVRGYCAKGERCTLKHLLECADYTQTGHCSRKHCPLWHRKKRSEGSKKRQKSKLGDRNATKEGKIPSTSKQDSSSFIVLRDDTEPNAPPSTSLAGKSEDLAAPIQIRPVFLKRL